MEHRLRQSQRLSQLLEVAEQRLTAEEMIHLGFLAVMRESMHRKRMNEPRIQFGMASIQLLVIPLFHG